MSKGQPLRHPDAKKVALNAAIGQQVRERRKAAKLTQDALSARIGIRDSTLHHIEDGDGCPVHTLVALADVFDCTLDDLVPVLTEAS